MKTFKIWFLSMFLAMILVVFVFAMVVDAEEKYKCLVDLHPVESERSGILRLGQTMMALDGYEYRVMGECRGLERNEWIQFIDSTNTENAYPSDTGKIDNKCDYALKIVMVENHFRIVEYYGFEEILVGLEKYCDRNKINIKDFVHFADPVKQKEAINSI